MTELRKVLVLNGPNLRRLGRRQPEVYGFTTYDELVDLCVGWGRDLGLDVDVRQTNHEGELVEAIQQAGVLQRDGVLAGVVLNAGAYTHTSIALADAIAGSDVRVIEVHISNVHARETFRHHSYVSAHAAGIIVGLGVAGYPLAIQALAATSSD
jgi:3-dehydroquinate dehydratase II